MSFIKLSVIVCAFISSIAMASPVTPQKGVDYLGLSSPQEVKTAPGKVEVIEFFMYHCPACNALEPDLAEWIKRQGDKVTFRRIHLPYHGPKDAEAHLFLTLDALGLEQNLHAKVLEAWHQNHQPLRTDEDNLEWAIKNGIDKTKFIDAYNSFSVTTSLTRLAKVVENYEVNSTPTFVVNGRYLTNSSMLAESNPKMSRGEVTQATFQVIDALVANVLKERTK
ncbi:thiol:disulfide interchange protein DsbA/DsbL [Undibacterium jejuense]|uniref:Thiol:disulfide interchange protein n=1 Tax=Undibacterium jejuense TaxID=1344949 RepID=A0A923HF72_9BURK|nr:thiol:disulfide interchange protein DsbA/DsbL [Undibacterium jejuense]MBC3860930.1 thiol:disulfide interchange protein DsbA/DsbL [Undibacterium jejuense]